VRYALKVQYIGKNYAGSQIQFENGELISLPTIQGELEKAIWTLIGGKSAKQYKRQVKTVFSGRTDSGVNSLGQVVHFDSEQTFVASRFVYSLNEVLPKDISVSDFKEVDKSFHALESAKWRTYRYEFINRKCKNAFDGDLERIKYDIDISRMNKSLAYVIGEHDFSAFKSSGTLNPSKICLIQSATAEKVEDKVVITFKGNRFLYNMVRTLVGTLLDIEGHNLEPEHMKMVIDSCDRSKAGRCVSPYGLTLMKVEY
jgi:tRNA pseudouridine38-40 synthase